MRTATIRNTLALFVSILLAQGIGLLGSLATTPNIDPWYRDLLKPGFTPPDAAFPIVWPLLFILMAVAAWLVWLQRHDLPEARTGLVWYGIQLVFNLGWSVVFFGIQSPGAALFEIMVLFAAIMVTTWYFYKVDIKAAILMTPYLLWILYAIALNLAIVILN